MTTPSTQTLAILFADIVGSTRLYDSLGNVSAKGIIDRGLSAMAERTVAEGGEIIKTIGDEIMCAFPSADGAARAARAMHRALSEIDSAPPLVAYIGFHLGEVLRENDDIFGDAVNVAARLVKLQRPRQALTTGSTLAAMGPELRGSARFIDRITLKGKAEPLEIFELVWESASLTVVQMPFDVSTLSRPRVRLELTVQGMIRVVESERSAVTLGRLSHNDVVVLSPHTSRTHARIEWRGDRFVLLDQSSNGTFVHGGEAEPRHLLRGEAPLSGSGRIGLGARADDGSIEPVHYRIFLAPPEPGA